MNPRGRLRLRRRQHGGWALITMRMSTTVNQQYNGGLRRMKDYNMRLSLVLCLSKANVSRCCNAWWRAACITVIHDYYYTFISLFDLHSYKAFYTLEEAPTVKLDAFRCLPCDLHIYCSVPLIIYVCRPPQLLACEKLVQQDCNLILITSLTFSITLLTQYHFSRRIFSRFFDYSSISLLQNRREKKIRTDGWSVAQNLTRSGGSVNHSEDL